HLDDGSNFEENPNVIIPDRFGLEIYQEYSWGDSLD
ncbi:uncharacterized protein METZ01_LOCUS380901, partial [marine metagenome]